MEIILEDWQMTFLDRELILGWIILPKTCWAVLMKMYNIFFPVEREYIIPLFFSYCLHLQ